MDKLIPNLIIINKMIIFCENILDEDINVSYFIDKLNYDTKFIDNFCEYIFDEYIKNTKEASNDHFLKVYYSTLKRFYRFVIKLIKLEINTKNNKDKLFSSLKEDRIHSLKDFQYRQSLKNNDKQGINEEEYSILLKGFEKN